ncbi:MAG: hypothetical protein DELT_03297 [Desulfovibrio sp.]
MPSIAGNIVPAFEIVRCNTAIRNMIREAKTHQIETAIASSAAEGMVTMDASLLKMCADGVISAETAIAHSLSPDVVKRKLQR